jgi:hypothetical protein
MDKNTKKKRVHYEPDKVRATSHWDLDYMPLKDVEAHFAQLSQQNDAHPKTNSKFLKPSSLWLGLILMATGIALIVAVVLLGRHSG